MQYRLKSRTLIVGFSLLSFAVYWVGLSGGFFFDDTPNLLVVPKLRLEAVSWDALLQAWGSGTAGPLGRPVAMLSFALNYYFSGFNPFVFKLTNLAIHTFSGLLVFAVAQHLLKTVSAEPQENQQVSSLAALVAALWLLHPIQVLPVLYVVQRMTSLSAMFLLVAIYLHICARSATGWRAHVALAASWMVLWPLSVLSKETGILFPALVLAWEVLIRWNSAGKLDGFARAFIVISLACTGAVAVYLISPASDWLWNGYSFRNFTLVERAYTEGRVLWLYIGLIVFPRLGAFGLYHDDLAVSTSLLSPWTTLPSLMALVVLALGILLLRKRAPLVAFGLAWFLIGHALESTVLPLEIAHEHRNYLPLFGLVLAAVQGVPMALGAINLGARVPVGFLAGLALLVCASNTGLRAYQFGEPVRRTQMEAQNHPSSARAQYEAGAILLGLPAPTKQTIAAAHSHLVAANAADANFKPAALGMIELNCQDTQHAGSAEVANLVQRLGKTPFAPGDRNILYDLKERMNAGVLCLTRAEVDRLFNAAIGNPTVSAGVAAILHSWHADYLWLNQRDMTAARVALAQSLKINPAESSNQLKWAQLLFISGERDAAGNAMLALKRENLSMDERKTLDELLAAITIQSP